MRSIPTILIVLLAPALVILAYQNNPTAQNYNLAQNLDKYSNEVASQEENYHREFDTPPSIIGGFQALQDKIVYPEEAKKQHIEGRVIVKIAISSQGKVTDASIAEGIEKGGLNEAALNAVRKVSFSPALRDDKPIAVRVLLPIQFTLDSSSDTGSLIYLNILDDTYISVNDERMDYLSAAHELVTWSNAKQNPVISLRAHKEVTQESVNRFHNHLKTLTDRNHKTDK
ncbi:MAG: TonB family protein [Candidatus Marinimicrobia bacterium]|nr:TonB family protein [Candidatus Neomarinimicrobiota bacterium]